MEKKLNDDELNFVRRPQLIPPQGDEPAESPSSASSSSSFSSPQLSEIDHLTNPSSSKISSISDSGEEEVKGYLK